MTSPIRACLSLKWSQFTRSLFFIWKDQASKDTLSLASLLKTGTSSTLGNFLGLERPGPAIGAFTLGSGVAARWYAGSLDRRGGGLLLSLLPEGSLLEGLPPAPVGCYFGRVGALWWSTVLFWGGVLASCFCVWSVPVGVTAMPFERISNVIVFWNSWFYSRSIAISLNNYLS